MTLKMTLKKPGFEVTGSDCRGVTVDIVITRSEAANYLNLVQIEKDFHATKAYRKERDELPDPERDLLIKHFGRKEQAKDSVLSTVLTKPREARDGIELNWDCDPVTAALRLIDQGHSHRLRLIDGALIDMGE